MTSTMNQHPDIGCSSLRYWLHWKDALTHHGLICMDCSWLFRQEGIWIYTQTLHGKDEQIDLCHCCWKTRIANDAELATLHDNTVSSRFYRWRTNTYDLPWWKLWMFGAEENCNRTIGIKTPWGLVFTCLNVPLRQKPCDECRSQA